MAGFLDRVNDLADFVLGRAGVSSDGSGPSGQLFTQTAAPSAAGPRVDIEAILREPTAMSCVNIITQGISQLPVVIKTKNIKGEYEIMPDHEVAVLLNKPNNFQSASEFKASVVTSLLIEGNAFIRIIRAGPKSDPQDGTNINGRIVQLVIMDADEMSIGADGFGFPKYYHETHREIANENMIHIRDFNVFTAQGQSRPKLAAEIVGAKIAADRLVGTTFRRGLNIKYAIMLDAKVATPELKKEQQEQAFHQFSGDGINSGGAIIIEGGSIQAIKGMTPADTDLRELRDQLKNEIAGVFRVPPYMVGGTGDEKFNNVRQKLASFHRDTLNPLIQAIEESFTLKLLDNPNDKVYFDVSELLKGDVETEMKLAVESSGGPVVTVNEARIKIGLNPLDDEEHNEIRGSGPEPEPQPTGGETGPRGGDDRQEESEDA